MSGLGEWLGRLFGRSAQPQRAVLPPVPTGEDLLVALAQVQADLAARARTGQAVPEAVVSRVERIAGTVREAVPRLETLGPGSREAHAVMATATSYLPEALAGYLRLPSSYRDRRPVDGGRTSLMVLIDQLDLLAATMDDIVEAAYRADAAALVAHGAFLAAKFGHDDDPLDLGTS